MKRFMKLGSAMLLLLLSAWACDSVEEITQPSLGPSGYAVFSNASGKKYVAVRAALSSGSVAATIGPRGGKISLGVHTLTVPRNAVSQPTEFVMSHADSDLIRLALTATSPGGSSNDVGRAGFNRPLKLEIGYEKGSNLPQNYNDLVLVYFRPDGLIEEQLTLNDGKGRKATGEIYHFSDFGLAWPSRDAE